MCAFVNGEERKCAEGLTAETVKLCDLVKNPQKYDGHLVKTDADAVRLIHTTALRDSNCETSEGGGSLEVLPAIDYDYEKDKLHKKLGEQFSKKGGVRVQVIGIFHDVNGFYEEGQSFRLDIKCFLSVEPLNLTKKNANGKGTAKTK
jgi:hypothetical protein